MMVAKGSSKQTILASAVSRRKKKGKERNQVDKFERRGRGGGV
jgi:hypothetical protein